MSQENVELALRTWELWNQGADDEVARRLAPNVEWHHQIGLGTPAEGIYRGREGVLELSRAMRDSFGVARVEIEDVRDHPVDERGCFDPSAREPDVSDQVAGELGPVKVLVSCGTGTSAQPITVTATSSVAGTWRYSEMSLFPDRVGLAFC